MKTKKLIYKFTKEYGEHIDLWDWSHISSHQKLSEDFIREFKDKVNWENISVYQKLSEDFIREFKDYINFEYLIGNKYCPPDIKFKYYRDNNLITKEDPSKHSIEQIEEKKDNSLDELKMLVGI